MLPSTVYCLPSTVYRLPSTVYCLPSTAYSLSAPPFECKHPVAKSDEKDYNICMQQVLATLTVIIPAGGQGRRMRHSLPKLLIPLAGIPVIEHTIRRFADLPLRQMIIPVSADIREEVNKICARIDTAFPINIIKGGAERQDSVWNALKVLDPGSETVAVHDAARPFFDPELLCKALPLLEKFAGAVAAIPATHTIKEAEGNVIRRTIPRETLRQVNTPQVFLRDALMRAYESAMRDGFYGTDDAMLLERIGLRLALIPDTPRNIKVTTEVDLLLAEAILKNPEE